jgi:NAD(P) transhydrogenase subunit beta
VNSFNWVIQLVYVLAASGFVFGLHLMNNPATARRGNQVSTSGMIVAIAATVALLIHRGGISSTGWIVILAGTLVGAGAGLYSARTVQMTAMPQLVSIFNAVGGGAAALVAIHDYTHLTAAGGHIAAATTVTTVLDVIIGSVTFSGSIIAAGKLQGIITSAPVTFPGARFVNLLLAVVAVGTGAYLLASPSALGLVIVIIAALAFGVSMVMPIGGADMPVVISLLNAFTGTAVAMAGFVINNWALIIAGALVGASGGILTKLMADAMNRSIGNIIIGGFGTGDSAVAAAVTGGAGVLRQVDPRTTRPSSSPTQQGDHRSRVRPGRRAGPACGGGAGQRAGGARRRGELRDPPRRGPDARAHERAAGRGERALPAAQGDG